jgi:hypothetical protein
LTFRVRVPVRTECRSVPLSLAIILGDPAPVSVIPESDTPVVHVQVPAGMATVSPPAAELMADCTSAVLQEFAVMVLACALVPNRAVNRKANKNGFLIPFSSQARSQSGALSSHPCWQEAISKSTVRGDSLGTDSNPRFATPQWFEKVLLKRDLTNRKQKTKVMNREEEHGANLLPLYGWSSPSL